MKTGPAGVPNDPLRSTYYRALRVCMLPQVGHRITPSTPAMGGGGESKQALDRSFPFPYEYDTSRIPAAGGKREKDSTIVVELGPFSLPHSLSLPVWLCL